MAARGSALAESSAGAAQGKCSGEGGRWAAVMEGAGRAAELEEEAMIVASLHAPCPEAVHG